MGKRGPAKGSKYKQISGDFPASVRCQDCGANATTRQDNGNPMGHFDARIPNSHNTLTYCKMESYR